jgi:hypothetical protein
VTGWRMGQNELRSQGARPVTPLFDRRWHHRAKLHEEVAAFAAAGEAHLTRELVGARRRYSVEYSAKPAPMERAGPSCIDCSASIRWAANSAQRSEGL